MKHFLNFIGGDFVATGKTFENRAPVDEYRKNKRPFRDSGD
ncbi:hypothetical protein [Pseudomonas aeruginosa]